jgi:threonine dehydrogenase-like Zn-dependent dehydrogenase
VRVATARAAVLAAPGRAVFSQRPVPDPGPGEVLVHVEGCGVCGSSLPLWEGRPWFTYPLAAGAPGHEVWGRTDDGRRVTGLSGHGFATIDVLRETELVELPEELDDVPFPGEALGCAVNVVRRADVRPDDELAVVGMGFLGTVVARLCEIRGARVTPVRRGDAPDGEFPRVIEAAGTQASLDTAARLVATGGTLVIAGFHQDGPRTVDLQSWNWRGIDVVNAHERDARVVLEGIEEAVRLAASGELDVAGMVTHSFSLEDLDQAFAAASRRGPGFLKAVVCP